MKVEAVVLRGPVVFRVHVGLPRGLIPPWTHVDSVIPSKSSNEQEELKACLSGSFPPSPDRFLQVQIDHPEVQGTL